MSNLSSILPANEARSNFYQILDEVSSGLRQFTVSHRGKPNTIIMSADEFAGWQETMEILANKKLLASINKALKSTKTISSEDADKLIGW